MYCSWLHAEQAISTGMSEYELKDTMNLQFQTGASEFQLMALLYAQHCAETNNNPKPIVTKKLYEYYGKDVADQIMIEIRIIFFGNLYFNTWKAILSRFKRKPAPGSNVIFEILYGLLNFSMAIPITSIVKRDTNK
jgi:hypothetical protein